MKRILMIIATLAISASMWSQEVFTVAFAVSDDGFVNVRERPSSKARVLTKLYMFSHGLGEGVLRVKSGNWTKVSVGKTTGWAYTKYVGTMNWYKGTGSPRLVAALPSTPIYRESMEDAAKHPLFTTVKKGTVIADKFEEDGEYYVLTTAHDNLFIKKTDAKIVR